MHQHWPWWQKHCDSIWACWWSDCSRNIWPWSFHVVPAGLSALLASLLQGCCSVSMEFNCQMFILLLSKSSMSICHSFQLVSLQCIMCLDPIQHFLLWSEMCEIVLLNLPPSFIHQMQCLHWQGFDETFETFGERGFLAVAKWHCLTSNRRCNYRSQTQWLLQSEIFAEDTYYSWLLPCHFLSFFSQSHPRCNAPNCHHLPPPL